MSAHPVLYEVNLSIAAHRAAEFDTWLAEHVAQMLELPGFIGATTMAEQGGGDATVGRSVHYELEDAAALERYFKEHAERMRAIGIARFGDDLSASRRILSTQIARPAEQCADCGSGLAGQYCASCGQRHRTRMISVFELTRDVFEDIFRWDSRVWRSMRPLLLSPGKLTNEYLDGRRTYYTPPLRMYFVLSILFFLLTSLPGFEDFNAGSMLGIEADGDTTGVTFSRANRDAQRPDSDDDSAPAIPIISVAGDATTVEGNPQGTEEAAAGDMLDDDSGVDAGEDFGDDSSDDSSRDSSDDSGDTLDEADCEFDIGDFKLPGVSQEALEQRLRTLCKRGTTAEGRRAFSNEFADLAPKLLIIMLPIIALASKMFYPLSRRYYVEHLLFYTHFHSFVFLLLLVIMILTWLSRYLPVVSVNTTLLSVAGGAYGVYYLYRAMRRVFGQGRLATLFKLFLIWLSYTIGTAVLTIIGAAIAAFSL